ncbi:MAG: type III pantothenate kinase [Candidatus Omnitrophota bacterium]
MNLLSVDIGNTVISFGVSGHARLQRTFYILTNKYSLSKLRHRLKDISIDEAIISSVVPSLTNALKRDLKRLTAKTPYIVGKDINVPIKNLYSFPNQVGKDRLVNAYAALRLYGAPLIVVDFGTAVTFDLISRKKEYLGGMILPGLNISLEALYKRTALLPKVTLNKPVEFIGRKTKNSILSGIVYGFANLTDGLIKDIRKSIGRAKVVATGGDSKLIKEYASSLKIIDTNLTLKGLTMLYYENKG